MSDNGCGLLSLSRLDGHGGSRIWSPCKHSHRGTQGEPGRHSRHRGLLFLWYILVQEVSASASAQQKEVLCTYMGRA